ncbi:MAG: peptidase inhibitor family I36 protein [Actinoplanes sp.]
MQFKSKIMAWSAAATIGLATMFVAPSAAQAAFDDCPEREGFCLWADPDGGGNSIWANGGLPDLRVQNMNDTISSVANNSRTRGLCLYPDLNYDGAWAAYIDPFIYANITDPGADDKVTSVQWAPSDNPPSCWPLAAAGKKTRVVGVTKKLGR